ncbi:MAG: phosphate ABC transporter substrate-binding protein [Desulfobacteraceae bacterium IS3]|nr:MAG: phosphate ABC transporter substrate-binding protein [Desulfobacteraceae bacterium IS3]
MGKGKNFAATAAALAFIFTAGIALAGNIGINGSTTVLPIAQKVSEEYMKIKPEVKISISGGGSGEGIKAIIDGTTDIANSSRDMKEKEIELAKEKGINPVKHTVAYDCIVPVVHPSNTLTNLTIDQLKALYKGEFKNWKELGGPDAPVVVISRDTSSGTYEVWEEKVMKKERVFPGAQLLASNGAVSTAVAKNKNAIGYIGFGYVSNEVKALTIGGIAGTDKTALDGTYPVSRPLFMFTQKAPEGEIKDFIDYILGPEGQKLVKESGFVPLK